MAKYSREIKIENNISISGQAQIDQDARTIQKLEGHLEDAQRDADGLRIALENANDKIYELRERISELESEHGIDTIKEKLHSLENAASRTANEFETFLKSMNLIDDWGTGLDNYREQMDNILSGAQTLSEAIQEVKINQAHLLEASYNSGGSVDRDIFQGFASSLSNISNLLDVVITKLNDMHENGVKTTGGGSGGFGGDIASVLNQIEEAAKAAGDSASSAYEPITKLVSSLIEFANLDTGKLIDITSTFKNIAAIGTGTYGTKSIDNIIRLANRLREISSEGAGSIKFDFSGISGASQTLGLTQKSVANLENYVNAISKIKVSKASVDNLTTLVPQINSLKVDTKSINNLIKLAEGFKELKVPKASIDNLNSLARTYSEAKVSKASVDNLLRLAEAYQTLNAIIKKVGITKKDIADQDSENLNIKEADATEELAKQEEARLKTLKQVATLLDRVTTAQNNWTKAQYGQSSESYQGIVNAKNELGDFLGILRSGGELSDQQKQRFSELDAWFKVYSVDINESGEKTKTFGDKIKGLGSQFAYLFSTTRIISMVVREVRQMINVSIEVENAMTQLQIVTRDTDSTMAKFADTAASSAKRIGSSVTDFVNSATTFARLGYDLNDSAMLAEYTAMLQNVGDIDVSSAQNAVTAIVKAFDIDVSQIESVMDKLVITGNNFPISVSQLAEGMNNASSALAAAGNSFDESVALLTAANVVVQNAAKSSTGLRTIAARMRNTKTELDELGETMTEANYEDLVKQLTKYQVALTDINGEYRSTYDVMSDIAAQWEKMTSMEQAALATALSGTRQQAIFYSIIEQFKDAQGAMDAMANSAGTLQQSYDIYLESTQAHVNMLKAAFQELSSNVIEGEMMRGVVDLGTAFLEFLNKVDKLVDSLGGFRTILMGVLSVLIMIKSQAIAAFITDSLKKLPSIIALVSGGLKNFVSIVPNAITGLTQMSGAAAGAGAAMQFVIPIVGALIAAITLVSAGISAYNRNVEEAAQRTRDAGRDAENEVKQLGNLIDEYIDLNEAIKDDYSVRDQLLGVQDQLIEALDLERSRVEALKDEYGNYADAIKQATLEKIQADRVNLLAGMDQAKTDLEKKGKTSWGYESYTFDETVERSTRQQQVNEYRALKKLQEAGYISEGSFSTYYDPSRKDSYTKGYSFSLGSDQDLSQAEGILATYEKIGEMINLIGNYYDTEVFSDLSKKHQELSSAVRDYYNSIASVNEELVREYQIASTIGKETPNTKEAFEQYRDQLIASINSSGEFIESQTKLEDVVDGILMQQPQFADFYSMLDTENAAVAESSEDAANSLTEVSKALSSMKTALELSKKASEEMRDGGLSEETINSLASANENYIDFLYEENGLIKLNTVAWEEWATAGMQNNITYIEGEIAALEAENEELIARRDLLLSVGSSGAAEEAQQLTDKINENTAAINANQQKLSVYETLFTNIASEADAYSQALANFANVNNAISSVSDSLKTVADLQDQVANGFTMSLDKALEFAAVYPEILNNATVAADGQIVLNEDVVNSFISGKEEEIRAQVDSEIAQLEADKAVLEAKMQFSQSMLDMAKNVGEGEGQISKELAEYRINAGNAVAKALIESGMDEASAFKLAASAMAGNAEEFNKVAAQVCTDVNGNFNAAAYAAAQAIYENMRNASLSLDGIIRVAHNAASAISGIGSGKKLGSTGLFGGAGGSSRGGASITLSNGTFNGVDYSFSPQTVALSDFISDLNVDIQNYSNAIAQIDGQIAALRALRGTGLGNFSSGRGSSSGGGGGGGGGGSSDSSSASEESKLEDWFTPLYKMHQHLLKMDAENVSDYLSWLDEAYKRAYDEGIISLEDFYSYQEEVYKGLQDLFKEYLSDTEHEISMRENFAGETKKIISLYEKMMADIEKEIAAARRQGLKDTDDYIQDLQSKWFSYADSIKKIREDVKKDAESSVEDLVQFRIKMLKQDIQNEKNALKEKKDSLKKYYSDQKKMLQDTYDEEQYMDSQREKRSKVADIQNELARLEYDNSAWAQKKKIQLREELSEAKKDLDEFEKDHALKAAQDELDSLAEMQEQKLDSQIDLLEAKENDSKALYDQALEDIKNGSVDLYNEMIKWNQQYGDGIDETITEAWGNAYNALAKYKELYGEMYKDINLANATNETEMSEKWNDSIISGGSSTSDSTPPTSDTSSSSSTSASSTAQQPEVKTVSTENTTVVVADSGGTVSESTSSTTTSSSGGSSGQASTESFWDKINQNSGTTHTSTPTQNQTVSNSSDTKKKVKQLIKNGLIKGGYAAGTPRSLAGLFSLDENGSETIFETRDGRKFRMFSGGEKVLNAEASDFLYKFANNGQSIIENMVGSAIGAARLAVAGATANNNISMGDIIINGNPDSNTVSEIRRARRDSVEYMLKQINKLNR